MLSVIIPAYNEKSSLEKLMEKLYSATKAYETEIIIIDDGSNDGTPKEILRLCDLYNKRRDNFCLRGYSLVRNLGKSSALNVGFDKARNEYVVLMDADLQDDPRYIPKFLQAIRAKNCDLVVGHRINRYKGNIIKLISSRVANYIVRKTLGYEVHDMNCGYKIMRNCVAKSLYLKSGHHRFIPLLATMNGFSVNELAIKQKRRRYGKSKYGQTGLLRGARFVNDYLTLIFIYKFSDKPFNLFGRSGIQLFILGFLICAYLTALWFKGNSIGDRPLLILGLLLLLLGVNLIGLGLLGELISDKYGKKKIQSRSITLPRGKKNNSNR